jgi:murein DD-endopeptidase MepM/ murein hydrolase activator NlpD
MQKTRKLLAVFLTFIIMSGVLGVTATATPDEWLPEGAAYLEPAVDFTGGEAGSETEAVEGSVGYTVQKGDNLLAIAARFGVPAAKLASANNLHDPNLIVEGQVLFVPAGRSAHLVSAGETLSGIALKYGVPLKDIAVANGLKNEDFLIAGRELVIPSGPGFGARLPAVAASRGLPVGELEWPVVGWVSSPFGFRDGKPHEGIDIAADYNAPIRAAMAGRVVFAGPRGTYGLTVILDHGEGLCTLYAHSSKIMVSHGEYVSEGQVIALVGNTGKSRGPHLHMEVLINGLPYDPIICFRRAYA